MNKLLPRLLLALGMPALLASGAAPAYADGGVKLLVESAIAYDAAAGTITLPLFQGRQAGQDVWYIVLDSSDRDDARARGVNWSPKLANAIAGGVVQTVAQGGAGVEFAGSVDFTPMREVVAGPTGFPPEKADPGSRADEHYSPLMTTGNGVVLNAPHVANASGLHDRVVSIDYAARRVTLELTAGLYHGKGILYISTEASDAAVAALEAATFTPLLNAAPGLASGDPLSSSRAAIIPIVNGPTGLLNPQRQGLQSAVLGEGSPLNVTEIHPRNRGEIPTYSPLWDVHPAVWTDAAIAAGERRRIDHHEDVIDLFVAGKLVSGGEGPPNPDLGGLQAADFLVNCPVLILLD